jgi:hypothetical protein
VRRLDARGEEEIINSESEPDSTPFTIRAPLINGSLGN